MQKVRTWRNSRGLEAAGAMFLFCSLGVKDQARVVADLHSASRKGCHGSGRASGRRCERLRWEPKQYPALNAYSQGVGPMGLSASKRSVVLIVEDEFLLRMDAVDMIAAAGFEVVEAANADQAIEILEARPDITVIFTDIQMPGPMGGQGPLAPDQDCRNLRPRPCEGNRSARRRAVSTQTLQSGTGYGRAARVDGRRLNSNAVIPWRVQRVGARRGPMTGFAANPESKDSPMCSCTSEVWCFGPSRNDGFYAMISGVIWSSMKAMRSRSCSLRFFSRCSRNKSGAGD